jgi:ABC-2 type transport system ATP-binding protein
VDLHHNIRKSTWFYYLLRLREEKRLSILLEVKNLTKTYGQETAAGNISFALDEHTSTALIGPNGAGKTTTLSMLAGLVSPTNGTIAFNKNKASDIREIIGFLPQYPKFFPWLSALEFTEMAARLSGVETKKATLEARKTLEFVGLGDEMKKKTSAFSGGMKQRLGLAQAIVHKPKLLLLDEPVSALDPVGRRQVMNLLLELQAETTILYSTHILNDAEEMTDQLLFLRQGALVEQGSLEDVRTRYAKPRILIEFEKLMDVNRFKSLVPWKLTVTGHVISIDMLAEKIEMPAVLALLHKEGFSIRKVERQTASLEEIFMEVAVIQS